MPSAVVSRSSGKEVVVMTGLSEIGVVSLVSEFFIEVENPTDEEIPFPSWNLDGDKVPCNELAS